MTRNINALLREWYLDYVNDYLTVEKFAVANEINIDDALNLIALGKKYHEDSLSN